MRTFLVILGATAAGLTAGALIPGCDDAMHSNYYDLGARSFKHVGDPCQPDVAPTSAATPPAGTSARWGGSCCRSSAQSALRARRGAERPYGDIRLFQRKVG